MPNEEQESLFNEEINNNEKQEDDSTLITFELEDKQKSEHVPPENSPRWKEVYGKMKQYEREIESIREEKESLKEMVEEMKSFNKKLAGAIETRSEYNEELDSKKALDDLKRQRKEAMESLDYDLVEDLSEKILDLKFKMNQQQKVSSSVEPINNEIQKEMKRFIDGTDWYKKDPEMRMYANQLDSSLLQDPEWFSRPIRERLAEVKNRVERRFGYKSNARNTVESGNTGRSTQVRLSQEELSLAKAFGISPDDWARQKHFMEGKK